jgi:hypothetical protein
MVELSECLPKIETLTPKPPTTITLSIHLRKSDDDCVLSLSPERSFFHLIKILNILVFSLPRRVFVLIYDCLSPVNHDQENNITI